MKNSGHLISTITNYSKNFLAQLQNKLSNFSPPIDLSNDYLDAEDGEDSEAYSYFNDGLLNFNHSSAKSKTQQKNLSWSSNLSVSDWLLLKKYQCEVLGMVMGCNFHTKILNQPTLRYLMGESRQWPLGSLIQVSTLEDDYHESIYNALLRLQQDAQKMGADAVVNIKINSIEISSETNTYEYSAIGTAIKFNNTLPDKKIILSTLTVTDFIKLLQTGSLPLGISYGAGVVYVVSDKQNRVRRKVKENQEIKGYTQGVIKARKRGLSHLIENSKTLNGHAILAESDTLGCSTLSKSNSYTDYLLVYLVFGSVISNSHEHVKPKIKLTYILNE